MTHDKTACDCCRLLRLMPQRRDVPTHLRRYRAADIRSAGAKLKAYRCAHCSGLWRWYAVDGWTRADRVEAARSAPAISYSESFA